MWAWQNAANGESKDKVPCGGFRMCSGLQECFLDFGVYRIPLGSILSKG